MFVLSTLLHIFSLTLGSASQRTLLKARRISKKGVLLREDAERMYGETITGKARQDLRFSLAKVEVGVFGKGIVQDVFRLV